MTEPLRCEPLGGAAEGRHARGAPRPEAARFGRAPTAERPPAGTPGHAAPAGVPLDSRDASGGSGDYLTPAGGYSGT